MSITNTHLPYLIRPLEVQNSDIVEEAYFAYMQYRKKLEAYNVVKSETNKRQMNRYLVRAVDALDALPSKEKAAMELRFIKVSGHCLFH
jgi:hypothetical protein